MGGYVRLRCDKKKRQPGEIRKLREADDEET